GIDPGRPRAGRSAGMLDFAEVVGAHADGLAGAQPPQPEHATTHRDAAVPALNVSEDGDAACGRADVVGVEGELGPYVSAVGEVLTDAFAASVTGLSSWSCSPRC